MITVGYFADDVVWCGPCAVKRYKTKCRSCGILIKLGTFNHSRYCEKGGTVLDLQSLDDAGGMIQPISNGNFVRVDAQHDLYCFRCDSFIVKSSGSFTRIQVRKMTDGGLIDETPLNLCCSDCLKEKERFKKYRFLSWDTPTTFHDGFHWEIYVEPPF